MLIRKIIWRKKTLPWGANKIVLQKQLYKNGEFCLVVDIISNGQHILFIVYT